jgi:probable phosphoglycerate mutase
VHLYLIRHGQSYVNLEEWTNGNTDEGLTELGHRQAAALAAWLGRALPHADALYASTLRRARETAVYVAPVYGLPIHFDDRLREIGNCRRDHTPWPNDRLPRDYVNIWLGERPFLVATPAAADGETMMHFRTRVGLFVEEVIDAHRGQTVVVVTHGGVIEAIFHHVFQAGPWLPCDVWDANTAITHFERVADGDRPRWRLYYHNRIDHLREIIA